MATLPTAIEPCQMTVITTPLSLSFQADLTLVKIKKRIEESQFIDDVSYS